MDKPLKDLPDLHAFHFVEHIGKGGFADVYLARHKHLDMLVAIKLLHRRLENQEALESFRQEARLVAQLEHPHIVRVLDFGIVEHTPYLVMNYASGGTLRRHIPKGLNVPLAQVVEYVSQIADALHFAHLHHVVHRDVKPENILFGRHGELLLSDFGIAIMVRDLSPKGQHVAGTAAYMAPEQVQRQPAQASDQYALAVMAYEWLCGERPFRGSSAQVMLQHLTALPPAFPHILALPPGVERVIHKALAKDPEARFASVMEFSQALRAASGLSVSTPVTISDITLPNQVDANLETTISDVDVAALQDVSMLSSSKDKLERIALFPLRRGPFERRGVLIFLIASAFPLLLLLPTLIGNGAPTSYMNENQLPSLSFLTWQLLIGPIVGSKRAPLVVAFVYMLVLVPLLVQGRVAIFAALGATLTQMIIAAGAGIWQERQKSYHFLSSLLLALVSIALSILSHSFMFQQPLFCPFISISASQPASYTFIPILAVLLASSMEWIVFLCVPSLRRLPQSPETAQQPRHS